MAEFINTTPQTVALGANVLFDETVIQPCCKVIHRRGSGIFTLKGGRYTVFFNGNVSGATAGTEVDLAIAINGEALPATTMASTPAVAEDLNNVSAMTVIDVPNCCCVTLSIRNVGTVAMTVDDANLVIRREEIA